jgi:hypothetical protein
MTSQLMYKNRMGKTETLTIEELVDRVRGAYGWTQVSQDLIITAGEQKMIIGTILDNKPRIILSYSMDTKQNLMIDEASEKYTEAGLGDYITII